MGDPILAGFENLSWQLNDFIRARVAENELVDQLRTQLQDLRARTETKLSERASAGQPPLKKRRQLQNQEPVPVSEKRPEVVPDGNVVAGVWEVLQEPSQELLVNKSEVIHVPRRLLQQLPYFEAMLSGPWRRDASSRCQVEVPCDASELSLLLRRICTGEPLSLKGSAIPGISAVLRLAFTADMLLIEDQLPELPSLLKAALRTPADVSTVLELKDEDGIPRCVQEVLVELGDAYQVPMSAICEMVTIARSEQAQQAAAAILKANRGRLDYARLYDSCEKVLRRGCGSHVLCRDIRWALEVANEHLDLDAAQEIFDVAATFRFCEAHAKDSWDLLREAFGKHLLRSAREGAAAKALQRACRDAATPTPTSAPASAPAEVRRCSLNFGQASCLNRVPEVCCLSGRHCQILTEMARLSPKEHFEISRILQSQSPQLLAEVLSEDLLSELGCWSLELVQRLSTDVHATRKWASAVRLRNLPLKLRRALSSSLLQEFDRLNEEVASVAMEAMTLAMGKSRDAPAA